jgi:hypothetical protein
MNQAHDTNKEIMELGHDPVPGYKPVFYVVFAVACVYLAALVVLYT